MEGILAFLKWVGPEAVGAARQPQMFANNIIIFSVNHNQRLDVRS